MLLDFYFIVQLFNATDGTRISKQMLYQMNKNWMRGQTIAKATTKFLHGYACIYVEHLRK